MKKMCIRDSHIGDFGVVIPFLVILQVEGGVDEAEVGEQPLGRRLDGQLEQVVVGIAGVEIDPFLHLENLHRENRGFPVSQPRVGGLEQIAHHHARLGGGVGAVLDLSLIHI